MDKVEGSIAGTNTASGKREKKAREGEREGHGKTNNNNKATTAVADDKEAGRKRRRGSIGGGNNDHKPSGAPKVAKEPSPHGIKKKSKREDTSGGETTTKADKKKSKGDKEATAIAIEETPGPPKKLKKGKRYQLVCKRWHDAIIKTIKANLHKRIDYIRSSKCENELRIQDANEMRAKGIQTKKRAWEADEESANRRKKKKAQMECHKWRRLAVIHYQEGEYADAAAAIEQAVTLGSIPSMLWLDLARCYIELFRAECSQSMYLEKAVHAYQHMLDLTGASCLLTGLPDSLLEVSRVYEGYGAFEGALSLLGMILESFPSYERLDETLFRSVVIMMHMSTLPGAPKLELILRCEEFLEKLMEMQDGKAVSEQGAEAQAKAPGGSRINEEALSLLYAHVAALEGSEAGMTKARSGYEHVFELRKQRYRRAENLKKKQANNAGRHSTWDQWLADPQTWDELAAEFKSNNEPILAIGMFQERERRAPYKEIEPLLEEAKTHLEFGDRDKAVYHGARAWQIDPYNDKVRTFLRHISSPFKAMFELEERAVSKLQKRWLLRAWRLSYVEKYHDQLVSGWEAELSKKPYHKLTREKLAYFAKHKWRRIFLYQELCATKIARWFKGRLAYRKFWASLRDRHVRELAFVYGKWRKRPFNPAVREEVKRMALHRYTPLGHRILGLLPVFNKEDKGSLKIQTYFRMWKSRKAYRRALGTHKQNIFRRKKRAALKVHALFRCLVVLSAVKRIKRRFAASRLIALWFQKRYRGHRCRIEYRRQLECIAWDKIRKGKRLESTIRLQRVWRGYRQRKLINQWRDVAVKLQARYRGVRGRNRVLQIKSKSALCIQRSWRRKVLYDQNRAAALLEQEEEREEDQKQQRPPWATTSPKGSRPNADGLSDNFKGLALNVLMTNKGSGYVPTGIFDSLPTFRMALDKPAMVFAPSLLQAGPEDDQEAALTGSPWGPMKETFDSQDAHLMANFLRYTMGKGCQLRSLVLCGADLHDDQAMSALSQALSRNRSLKTLALGNCQLSATGANALFRGLKDNYHMEELVYDSMPDTLNKEDNEVALCALASDYFMQKFGSLHCLSFCGNGLSDLGAGMVAQALASPWCRLTSLHLADNCITDAGGVLLGTSLRTNKTLLILDLSSNKLETKAGGAFAEAIATNTTLQTLLLKRNLIRDDVVSPLLDSLKINMTLQTLDISYNIFRKEREQELVDAMVARREIALRSREEGLAPVVPLSSSSRGGGRRSKASLMLNIEEQGRSLGKKKKKKAMTISPSPPGDSAMHW